MEDKKEYDRGHVDSDRATLRCIPEKYRVTPTTNQRASFSVAVGASIGAMRERILELEMELEKKITEQVPTIIIPPMDGTKSDLERACEFLDANYPNINTRFVAMMYGRTEKEHQKDRTAERIIETAQALGWKR